MNLRTSALLALCFGVVLVGIFVARKPAEIAVPAKTPADARKDDLAARRKALSALATSPDGVPALLEALKNAELREDAANALRSSGERANAPLLTLAQEPDTAVEVRAAALAALTPVAANVEPLSALLDDPAQPVRGAAEQALIAIGTPSLDRVAKIYADRKAPMFARERAAAVLAGLGDPAVGPIARVIERANNDDVEFDNVTIDTSALSAGVDALSRIGTPAADEALARLVEEEHPYVYEQALTALASKQSDERMRLMLRFMKRCIDPYHCQPIGEALAAYGPKVQPDLIRQLKSGSWEEDGPRAAAAVALGRIGTDEAVDALVPVLRAERGNDVRDVYDAVAEALARCTNPRAAAFVSERVAKRDYRFIAGAYETLKERIGSDLILKALEEEGGFSMASGLINDADPVLRNGARRWAEDNGHRVEEWKPGRTITP